MEQQQVILETAVRSYATEIVTCMSPDLHRKGNVRSAVAGMTGMVRY